MKNRIRENRELLPEIKIREKFFAFLVDSLTLSLQNVSKIIIKLYERLFMKRLLVVDDEEKIRLVIRKYAEFEGYEIEEAENGMKAIQMCRQKDFDLIILDIMMPELDGFSTCKEIRKEKDIPVIMLSARGEEYDKIHGFELGIDDYVVKPFSPKELMMRVNVVISRHQKKESPAGDGHEIFEKKVCLLILPAGCSCGW